MKKKIGIIIIIAVLISLISGIIVYAYDKEIKIKSKLFTNEDKILIEDSYVENGLTKATYKNIPQLVQENLVKYKLDGNVNDYKIKYIKNNIDMREEMVIETEDNIMTLNSNTNEFISYVNKKEEFLKNEFSKEETKNIADCIFADLNICNVNDYKLVFNPVNKGTVYNTYSGLLAAEGKYIKFISPGDMLYKDDTLKCWFSFMESKSLGWSFSDVIYYKKNNDNIIPIEVNTHPQNVFIYESGDDNDIRWQYFVLSDTAVGASMLCLRELQLKYCKEILGRVIYAEDNIWRMMMFDGITGGFYNAHTILYEWGSGVSTSNSSIWEERLHNDWINADKILLDRKSIDSFQLEMKKAYDINRGSSKLKKIFIKGKLKNKLFVKKRKSINYLP